MAKGMTEVEKNNLANQVLAALQGKRLGRPVTFEEVFNMLEDNNWNVDAVVALILVMGEIDEMPELEASTQKTKGPGI